MRNLRPDDWPEVARIFEEGIATGNATFETEVPSWEDWDGAHLVGHRFAAQNDGVYAGDLSTTTTISGETIVDMLPHNSPLRNPFTGIATEPIDGAASTAGQTGYEPVVDGSGQNVGYIITGYGRTDLVTRLSNGN